jgi:CheY-like chemotaxis protein
MAEILLVDDDQDLGFIVKTLARRAGHGLTWCPDVPSAWAELGRARPDLLLLDVNLPGVSGLELCRHLRQTPGLAGLPVALFTQLGLPGDIAAGLEAGADFLVAKELVCRPADLQQRLAEILQRLQDVKQADGEACKGGGQRPVGSLGCPADSDPIPLPHGWVEAVNRALAQPAFRQLGVEVMQVVLRRAVRQAVAPARPERVGAPLEEEGRRFDSHGVLHAVPPQAAARLVVVLADQLWCLLGSQGSAPFREAMRGWVSGEW